MQKSFVKMSLKSMIFHESHVVFCVVCVCAGGWKRFNLGSNHDGWIEFNQYQEEKFCNPLIPGSLNELYRKQNFFYLANFFLFWPHPHLCCHYNGNKIRKFSLI